MISPQEEQAAAYAAGYGYGSGVMKTLLFIGIAGGTGYLLYRWLR
jgi:hypothetical protein